MITPLVVIQARMASNRLPGKVMLPLGETSVIDVLIKRLNSVASVNEIVVATTNQKTDDELCDYLLSQDIQFIRGSEEDVLDRFEQCATSFEAKDIIRVTADCPFIDPDIVEQLIHYYQKMGSDYSYLSPKFAEGLDVEIFSILALRQAFENANLRSEREHVTLYFSNNPDKFKISMLDQTEDHSQFRFTLDNKEDYEVLLKIYDYFKGRCAEVSSQEIINFLRKHKSVFEINSGITRNEGLLVSLEKDEFIENE